jgi:hypothetical protein
MKFMFLNVHWDLFLTLWVADVSVMQGRWMSNVWVACPSQPKHLTSTYRETPFVQVNHSLADAYQSLKITPVVSIMRCLKFPVALKGLHNLKTQYRPGLKMPSYQSQDILKCKVPSRLFYTCILHLKTDLKSPIYCYFEYATNISNLQDVK